MSNGSPNLNPDKLELIDYVFQRCEPRPATTADLGGVWGVNGGYTLHALSKHRPNRSILVDTNPTRELLDRARSFPDLHFIQGNFGDPLIRDQVGRVGVIFLFDVLLHQVKPDWDEILKMYAPNTDYFVIFNQQWTASRQTVRLLDLGKEEYFRNVPHEKGHPTYVNLFEKMYEVNAEHGRIWRDIHNVWQWGITDADLTTLMNQLGFRLLLFKSCGKFGTLPNIENHSFVYQKRGAAQRRDR